MSDTAAFFANKKKKKKAFKFNANLVDASTITSTTHVDAPALSNEQDPAVAKVTASVSAAAITEQQATAEKTNGGDEDGWDDEALAATLTKKKVPIATTASAASITPTTAAPASTQPTTAELLEMKSLDTRRDDHDSIAEKLRVEETKAQLAAARQGMERQAAKLKEEAEKKEQEQKEKAAATASRFSAASGAGGSSTGKWVPPHLRSGGLGGSLAMASSRNRMPGGFQKVDTQNEELFPDLATADTILEKQHKEQRPAYGSPKKTPVGGGASWASKSNQPSRQAQPKPQQPPAAEKKEEPKKEEPKKEVAPAPKPAPAPAPASAPKPKRTITKKKKKDLSTFKPQAAAS